MESKNSEGIFDASVHLKAQVDQLTGRNEELRRELKQAQKEATNFSSQLANANEKVYNLFYSIYLYLKSGCSGNLEQNHTICKTLNSVIIQILIRCM